MSTITDEQLQRFRALIAEAFSDEEEGNYMLPLRAGYIHSAEDPDPRDITIEDSDDSPIAHMEWAPSGYWAMAKDADLRASNLGTSFQLVKWLTTFTNRIQNHLVDLREKTLQTMMAYRGALEAQPENANPEKPHAP